MQAVPHLYCKISPVLISSKICALIWFLSTFLFEVILMTEGQPIFRNDFTVLEEALKKSLHMYFINAKAFDCSHLLFKWANRNKYKFT